MRIGIVGAGGIGQAVGRPLGRAGHNVLVSWSSSDARLQVAGEQIGFGARAVTLAEAVKDAAAVVFSPRWEHIDAAIESAGAERTGTDRLVGSPGGDDPDATAKAADLVRDAGPDPVDVDAIADSASMDPGEYLGGEFHLADVPAYRACDRRRSDER